jgi:hypothetical protein
MARMLRVGEPHERSWINWIAASGREMEAGRNDHCAGADIAGCEPLDRFAARDGVGERNVTVDAESVVVVIDAREVRIRQGVCRRRGRKF